MFLHGVREDSFAKFMNIMDHDVDRRPSPSYWSFVCLLLHKHVIDGIRALSQVKTNVGYCRAFIRASLNDYLLSSYFQNIRKSQHLLKTHFHGYAFLYDYELVETVENLLLGIESYVSFKLPLNSSLLNQWNDNTLIMVGIYSVPMRSLPLAYGEDAVSALPHTNTGVIDIPTKNFGVADIYAASISNSIFSNSPLSLDLDDDENLARILRESDESENKDANSSTVENQEDADDAVASTSMLLETNNFDAPLMNESIVSGNSILGKQCWSEPMQNLDEEQPDDNIHPERSQSIISVTLEEKSYMTLFNEKQRRDTLNFKEVWEKFQKSVNQETKRDSLKAPEGDESDVEDFEVVKNTPKNEKEINELQYMVELLCRLSNEVGLDAQGFLCNGCKILLGIELSKSTVCHFDGHYYCSHCISNDKFQIPAKIIYNWDFKYYTVSKRAGAFLIDYQFKPFIDFKVSNWPINIF